MLGFHKDVYANVRPRSSAGKWYIRPMNYLIRHCTFFIGLCLSGAPIFAQVKDSVVAAIVKEETDNSQLQKLAHELFDVIGPRLVGTPQMEQAHDWAISE